MDNVTRTLVGVALAETGLKRWTPRATTTLLIGANRPTPPPARVALARPELRGLANWLRFPTWTVQATEDGYDVGLNDVRFSRFMPASFGRQVTVLRSDVPNR